MKKNRVCVISGPTASGKTGLSIELAKTLDSEIVNFDSLLFYKEITIGTAKPSLEERQGIIHHLVDTHSINDPINAADFMRLALPIIKDIHARDKTAILVGGSGFYLQTLLKGMYDSTTSPQHILERSDELYQKEGINPFLEILKENDPESYERYHSNDHYRVRRAVEYFWANDSKLSEAREQMKHKVANSPAKELEWTVFYGYLDIPKEEHFPIIQQRSREMVEQGLIQEVQQLLDNGFNGDEKPLQSIGYKQVIEYLKGQGQDVKILLEKIDIATRQLAKAQRTWFKKESKLEYNGLSDRKKFIQDCLTFFEDN
jgi:tRNA dimethylallyltransferase